MTDRSKTFFIIDPAPLIPGWGWYISKHVDEDYRVGLLPPDNREPVIHDAPTPEAALNGALMKVISRKAIKSSPAGSK